MACSCSRRTKAEALNQIQSAPTLPHLILPGESCIFCTEKHLSVAYTAAVSYGFKQITRQSIIGELECARRHSFVEYAEQSKLIAQALRLILMRQDPAECLKALDIARESVSKMVETTQNGEDRSTAVLYNKNLVSPKSIHPIIGELYFCAAWRLAYECGYFGPNKNMIIGDLSMAQVHLFNYNYKFTERLRDIRHRVQRTETQHLNADWIIAAQNIDVDIIANLDSIKKTYGDDINWYLNL